jgi:hypothetical protein
MFFTPNKISLSAKVIYDANRVAHIEHGATTASLFSWEAPGRVTRLNLVSAVDTNTGVDVGHVWSFRHLGTLGNLNRFEIRLEDADTLPRMLERPYSDRDQLSRLMARGGSVELTVEAPDFMKKDYPLATNLYVKLALGQQEGRN